MTNGCPKSVTHHQDIFSSECQFLCYGLLGKWPIYQCLVNFGQVCIIAIFNFLFVYRRFCLKFCLQQVKCIPSQFQFWSVNRQNDYGLTANPKAQPPPPPTPHPPQKTPQMLRGHICVFVILPVDAASGFDGFQQPRSSAFVYFTRHQICMKTLLMKTTEPVQLAEIHNHATFHICTRLLTSPFFSLHVCLYDCDMSQSLSNLTVQAF